jgi:4-amino-4-deoxy-L-arabinose transferase-like glycosyltransferase
MAQTGMFVDGVVYASVARNLASGIGTFWAPSYTTTLYPEFFEHPPLVFGLQGAAFAVFGDHIAVERAYSLAIGCLTAVLMMLIWRNTVGERRYDWLPLLFWLLPGPVTWSIANNMLENTQTMFTTLAVLALVRSLRPGAGVSYGWACITGLSILGAVLSKGPVGLFPLAAPVIMAVVMRHRAGDALLSGAIMLATVVLGSAIVLAQPAARASLGVYWTQQVVASVRGERELATSRWSLGWNIFAGVVLRMSALAAIGWIYSASRGVRSISKPAAWTWFFLGMALAGSVPIAISAKIMGVYLVPSMPFYALGFASLVLPSVKPAFERRAEPARRQPVLAIAGVFLLVLAVAGPLAFGPFEPRDVDSIAEYRGLSASIPRGATLGTCESMRLNFGLHGYMQRLFRVSLDPDSSMRHTHFLQVDGACLAPPACRPMATSGRLTLLQCEP